MTEKHRPRPLLRRIRALFAATPYAEPVDLGGRKIIVTGASPGSIGFETARILASWGASVVVTTRSNPQTTVEALRDVLPDTSMRVALSAHALDLCNAGSVAGFVDWYVANHGDRLDVLINNAGIHLDLLSKWKEPTLSADGFEIHWRTNYLGTTQLTRLLLPLLQKTGQATGDARIVNVVSMLHDRGSNAGLFQSPTSPASPYNSWVAYGLSKLALIHATFEMQRRFAATYAVQAYCLHPGAVFTNIAGKGLAGNALIETLRNAFAPIEAFFLMTPEEGAQTQVYCATHPGLAGGLYYRQCRAVRASADSSDAATSARLWDATQAWLARSTTQALPRQ